jgi:hypothetical protein
MTETAELHQAFSAVVWQETGGGQATKPVLTACAAAVVVVKTAKVSCLRSHAQAEANAPW